jgi:DNA polymerase elongation subunit (family B)
VKQQDQFDGWLLDVSTHGEGVILWIKTMKEQRIVKVLDEFRPEFFAVPKKKMGSDLQRFKKILEGHPNVKSVSICEKYVRLEDHKKRKILGVSVAKPSVFKKTIQEISEIDLFTLYNTDLPISQMYFYVKDLFPMSLCSFKVRVVKDNNSKNIMKLESLVLNDDNEELFYDLPPLKAIWLDIKVKQQGLKSYYNDPLEYAEISIIEKDENSNIPRADGQKKRRIRIEKANEADKLKLISKVIEKLDPDIILTHGGDEFVFPYLAARASINHVSRHLYFSRTKTPLKNCIFELPGGSDHYMSYGIIMRRSKTHFN